MSQLQLEYSDEAAGWWNTQRPLTHSLDLTKEGLAVDATQTPEEWRPVPSWEGLYEVSDLGRVRSVDRVIKRSDGRLRRFKGKVLRPISAVDNYLYVNLCASGLMRRARVHHLVAAAFIGPRPSGRFVLHYNDVRTDNRLVNLRYGTSKDNGADKARNGHTFNGNKTHCKWGHEFTPENTRPRPGRSGRTCVKCTRDQDRYNTALRRARQRSAPASN